jgi:dipeptidyl aminopeptidase/acylaminoacyl peptidase
MSRLSLWIAAVCLLLPQSPALAELPPLIPRKVLFGNPVRLSPQISPDGKRLAYLAPDNDDNPQVWVRTLGKNDDRKVTADEKRGIHVFLWTYAPDTLIYLQDQGGDENFHVYSIDLAKNIIRDLTPFVGIRANPLSPSPDSPNELLVTLNLRDRSLFDVHRIDLTTGAIVLDTKNPGDVLSWIPDPKYRIRAVLAVTPDGGREVRTRADAKAPWKKLFKWDFEDGEGSLLDFTADGQGLWLTSSAGRDTRALVKYDLKTGKEEVAAAVKGADVGGVIYDFGKHRPQLVGFERERSTFRVLDPALAPDVEFFTKKVEGEMSVVSRDGSQNTWVVATAEDVKPTHYHLYDRQKKKLTYLFSAQPALEKFKLAPMRPVTIKSRDGLELVCYLTLPLGAPAKKLPLVLDVHGGPWARDSWGFRAQTQWLANRGYAVLSVNYRGSAGFGKKFLNAGNREWGGKMHDDLIDACNWAVKQGSADPKRIAIYGGSYGGYAALVGAAFTPDYFRCAVDIVGPSNLVTLLKSIPPYFAPLRKSFALRVGDPEKEEDFLKSRSPLFKADKIKIPLLIAQGANDPRVRRAESERIVEALRKRGKEVEYMVFGDEGHGFSRAENRLKFYAATEKFLAKHLGGRAEP